MGDHELATFGGGCFWCIEAALKELTGVTETTAGYAGGQTENPTYKAVCTGDTGHAEVVQVEYDTDILKYPNLLEVFFTIHDPTQLNRQGPDVGTQYRSIVLYHTDRQETLVRQYVETLEEEGLYEGIVTEIQPLDEFWPAEEKHQNYFEKNPNDAYCSMHAAPKVETVREEFADTVATIE